MPALIVLALFPVVWMLTRGFLASRNVPYWDEFDSALQLLLRLDDKASWSDVVGSLLAVSNEHRMVTSRLMFAAGYWLTGTVNFVAVGVIGNLFVCGLCVLLIWNAGAVERRLRMMALLVALLFQLQHFENFFWSGSSIDHFQVPLLAAAAFVALAGESRWALWAAGGFGLLATFTLAHGLVVWPVGCLMLLAQRRWRPAAIWSVVAAGVIAAYFSGFAFNPGHHVGDFSAGGLVRIARYWLELLGAPLAFGHTALAVLLGLVLLALLAWQVAGGFLRRERVALSLAIWASGALLLVAIGRVNVESGTLASRYYVLGALAWALVLFIELGRRQNAANPFQPLLHSVPLLIAFNVAANFAFAGPAQTWLVRRDRAVEAFLTSGRDGAGVEKLHPMPRNVTRLIQQVEEAGIYRMPGPSEERLFPQSRVSENLVSSVDRVEVTRQMILIEGWAGLKGRDANGGRIHVVLRSNQTQRVFTTMALDRPDVAAAYPDQKWQRAGFRFELRPWLLPQESFEIGVLIESSDGAEYVMSSRRLELSRDGRMIGSDLIDPSGNPYDAVRVQEPITKIIGLPKKLTRLSFFDEADNLVHVDFVGAGSLTLVLEESSGPLTAPIGGRLSGSFMKGRARIEIDGADETTNVSILASRSRGRSTAVRDWFSWGIAHVACVSITSSNGKFGSMRAGNARFSATQGLTGVHAPGVRFTGLLFVGDIDAFDAAIPILEVGSARDVRITGGDLFQHNGQPVRVGGFSRLPFVAGRTAQGIRLPEQNNRGVLVRQGRDVSDRVAWDRQRREGGTVGLSATDPRLAGQEKVRRARGAASD